MKNLVDLALSVLVMFLGGHLAESVAQGVERIRPEGIGGTLVIVGGGSVPTEAKKTFAKSAAEGIVVVIGAASADPGASAERCKIWLADVGVKDVVIGDRLQDADALAQAIATARGVWICGGKQMRLSEAYVGTEVETELLALLDRGGVVGGSSAGAAIMSKSMIASGRDQPSLATGFDLLPRTIIDQHFSERSRLNRSRVAVVQRPGRLGIGLDEGTALVVRGRRMFALGAGKVTILLGPSSYRTAEELQLSPGDEADLTQLLRAARARADNVDPGVPRFGAPAVANGSLVIVGGGGMPQSVVDRFIELAGGSEAHIAVIPTAGSRESARRARVPGFLRDADVASVTMLPQVGPNEVAEDVFQSSLQKATGVWFGGGRQWNFIDAYEGTNAVDLFRGVLERGGVIGGSSAGATIQGEFLVRGHPLGNTVMMAEGYERGFAFLPGTAIDQHFTQRGRLPDLLPVVRQHPRMLGIGIDESTALVVSGTAAEVIGEHSVHFLTADALEQFEAPSTRAEAGQDEDEDRSGTPYISFASGATIDLSQFAEALETAAPAGRP